MSSRLPQSSVYRDATILGYLSIYKDRWLSSLAIQAQFKNVFSDIAFRALRRSLDRLVDLGIVSIKKRRDVGTPNSTPNFYKRTIASHNSAITYLQAYDLNEFQDLVAATLQYHFRVLYGNGYDEIFISAKDIQQELCVIGVSNETIRLKLLDIEAHGYINITSRGVLGYKISFTEKLSNHKLLLPEYTGRRSQNQDSFFLAFKEFAVAINAAAQEKSQDDFAALLNQVTLLLRQPAANTQVPNKQQIATENPTLSPKGKLTALFCEYKGMPPERRRDSRWNKIFLEMLESGISYESIELVIAYLAKNHKQQEVRYPKELKENFQELHSRALSPDNVTVPIAVQKRIVTPDPTQQIRPLSPKGKLTALFCEYKGLPPRRDAKWNKIFLEMLESGISYESIELTIAYLIQSCKQQEIRYPNELRANFQKLHAAALDQNIELQKPIETTPTDLLFSPVYYEYTKGRGFYAEAAILSYLSHFPKQWLSFKSIKTGFYHRMHFPTLVKSGLINTQGDSKFCYQLSPELPLKVAHPADIYLQLYDIDEFKDIHAAGVMYVFRVLFSQGVREVTLAAPWLNKVFNFCVTQDTISAKLKVIQAHEYIELKADDQFARLSNITLTNKLANHELHHEQASLKDVAKFIQSQLELLFKQYQSKWPSGKLKKVENEPLPQEVVSDKQTIQEALNSLPEHERGILVDYYLNGIAKDKLAPKYKHSKDTIRQIIATTTALYPNICAVLKQKAFEQALEQKSPKAQLASLFKQYISGSTVRPSKISSRLLGSVDSDWYKIFDKMLQQGISLDSLKLLISYLVNNHKQQEIKSPKDLKNNLQQLCIEANIPFAPQIRQQAKSAEPLKQEPKSKTPEIDINDSPEQVLSKVQYWLAKFKVHRFADGNYAPSGLLHRWWEKSSYGVYDVDFEDYVSQAQLILYTFYTDPPENENSRKHPSKFLRYQLDQYMLDHRAVDSRNKDDVNSHIVTIGGVETRERNLVLMNLEPDTFEILLDTTAATDAEDAEDEEANKTKYHALHKALNRLPERDCNIIKEYYGFDGKKHAQEELAIKYGVSAGRISHIITDSQARLAELMSGNHITKQKRNQDIMRNRNQDIINDYNSKKYTQKELSEKYKLAASRISEIIRTARLANLLQEDG